MPKRRGKFLQAGWVNDRMTDDAPQALISLSRLRRPVLEHLLDAAETFLAAGAAASNRDLLAGEAAALVFCEPSTRTRFSFELAARRLGADVLVLEETASSRVKGETLEDTLETLHAMGCRYFVVRHSEDGIMTKLAASLPAGAVLVSAGEGTRAHPTQGLLDTLTIRRHRPDLDRLAVAIVGDVSHSRVARSTAAALAVLGVRDLRLVGPKPFLPASGELPGTPITDLARGIKGADVVIALRIQRERMTAAEFPDPDDYRREFGLSIARLEQHAAAEAILLHPGPVNWGVELEPELAAWPRCLIREQVHNGVAVRMAVLAWLGENLRNGS